MSEGEHRSLKWKTCALNCERENKKIEILQPVAHQKAPQFHYI